MKKKEIDKIARQILQLETIISGSTNEEEIKTAKNKIMAISRQISIEDMFAIDEKIYEIIDNQKKNS